MGSFEYWNSLRQLEQLLKISNSKEIEFYDELISTRPEFSFHIGLAKAIAGDEIDFDATKIVLTDSGKATDIPRRKPQGNQSLRTGLAWLMALARVELGSSLAAYTDSESPFDTLKPTAFDRRQFELLVYDDALFHWFTLTKDRDFQAVSKKRKKANLLTLDYWRRLKLTRDMLAFASQSQLNGQRSQEFIADLQKKLKRKAENIYTNITIKMMELEARAAQKNGLSGGNVINTPLCAAAMLEDAISKGDLAGQSIGR